MPELQKNVSLTYNDKEDPIFIMKYSNLAKLCFPMKQEQDMTK